MKSQKTCLHAESDDILSLYLVLEDGLKILSLLQAKTLSQHLRFVTNFERILEAAGSDAQLNDLLQNAGTNVDAQDDSGLTALGKARIMNHKAVVKLLKEQI
jgi:hypothetical protein